MIATEDPPADRLDYPADLDRVVEALRQARHDWRAIHPRHTEHGSSFPARQALKRITRELGTALFPLRLGPPELTPQNEHAFIAATLESTLSQLAAQIGIELRYRDPAASEAVVARGANRLIGAFAAALPRIRRALDRDVEAGYASDPAARSVDEVLVAYPSLTAVIHHRLAHELHRLGATLVARIVAELAHADTGIDIHPGATIGSHFFIDHGSGVVIGETAIIGDRVRLYQGVTLGGDPAAADRKGGEPRHPIVGDDVVILANTSIVGRVRIGDRARIGGNLWLGQDVPADGVVEAAAPLIGLHASRQAPA